MNQKPDKGNCPFCDPGTSWGMSPEAWDDMRELHDRSHTPTQSAPDKCRVQGCTKKHLLEPITECLVCGAIDKTCFHPLQSTPDKTSMEKWDSDFTKRVAKQLREDGVPKVEGMKIITTPVDKSLRAEIRPIVSGAMGNASYFNEVSGKDVEEATQSILQALSNRLPEIKPVALQVKAEQNRGFNQCLSEVRAIIEAGNE